MTAEVLAAMMVATAGTVGVTAGTTVAAIGATVITGMDVSVGAAGVAMANRRGADVEHTRRGSKMLNFPRLLDMPRGQGHPLRMLNMATALIRVVK